MTKQTHNTIKTIILLIVGGELYHVYLHVSWQFMMENNSFNFLITRDHNIRSIISNSLVIILAYLVLFLISKRQKSIQ